ncbi:mannose-1-phosphate guanylyltransferase/mannose-6-phosphate isomerase [Desulfovibrio sp. OttesenSCG-928-A18]|nr:mannose-1-phosphate guanylyltransferase/mannose-6-phosphate isomerase [Desulfovibrio sp. OttesenSCG-928-A18]
MLTFQPVILSGGSGTRLWPMSRGMHPKQFMDLGGETLFAGAVSRALALENSVPPIVICNEEHRFLAAEILREREALSDPGPAAPSPILLEPVARNTAPAVALCALAALERAGEAGGRDEDPLLLVLSSDHIITPEQDFVAAVKNAAEGMPPGRLAVFGVPAARPESGFGYIRQGEALDRGLFSVAAFVEKPDRDRAEEMLRTGGHVWNSGIFLCRASLILRELERLAPEVHKACLAIWETRQPDLDFMRFSRKAFAACPAISFDYAVMERTDKACVAPLPARWNDMGSWEAFYETSPKDERGNAMSGDVLERDCRDCYLHSGRRLVAAVGLQGISVVETPDAVLVTPRQHSREVTALVEELRRQKRPEADSHLRVYRPWGSYELLSAGDRFQVKRIIVKPGGVLSLQMHHHRAEHWVVVRGTARVALDKGEIILKEDESSYIPIGSRHRLENPGRIDLEIIEIQTGSYLGEDDIVRFEDSYGRIPSL